MKQLQVSATAGTIGLVVLMLAMSPSFATQDTLVTSGRPTVQLAHMTEMPNEGTTEQPCPMGMMQQGMMTRSPDSGGWHRHGPGQEMHGPGKKGQGMTRPGRAGRNLMAPRMMGTDRYRRGALFPRFGDRVVPSSDLSTDDVRDFFDHRSEMPGNKRLKAGYVKKAGKDKIIADIVTVDDSLVQRLEVDRHSGEVKDVE